MQTPLEYAATTAYVTSELDRLLGEIPPVLELTGVFAFWDEGSSPGGSAEAVQSVDPFGVHASQLLHMALVSVIEPAWPDGTDAQVRPAVLAVVAVFMAQCARRGFEPATLTADIEAAIECATSTVTYEHRSEAAA